MIGTLALLTSLTVILLGAGWLLGGIIGTGIALFFAVAINFVSYWYSDRIVLKMYKAKPYENKEIKKIIAELAQEAEMPVPPLYIVETQVPNAFATGRNPKHAAVAVTRGILDLDTDELKGVLAHEISHVKNRDTLISTMAASIAGAISFLAQIGYYSMFFGGERKGEGSIFGMILIAIFAPLAALFVKLAISRGREYKADLTGAMLTKEPHYLASALRKINETAKSYPMKGSAATAHLWIVNPFQGDWFVGLFSTHPPVEKRIARLEGMEDYNK